MPTSFDFEEFASNAAADYRGSNLADGLETNGRFTIIKSTWTADGNQSDEDDIALAYLPKGTILMGPLSYVNVTDAVAATITIHVGTVTDDDAIATSLDVASTGVVQCDEGFYELTVDEHVQAKIKTLGTPEAGAIDFYIAAILP